MNAGALRNRVQIQSRRSSRSLSGEEIVVWTTILTCWAAIVQNGGKENRVADVNAPVTDALITIRYSPLVKSDMRVLFGADAYAIYAVMDPQGRREWIHLNCTKGLSDG